MPSYKVLNNQVFKQGNYQLVPIRHQDRYEIMHWRNEQIYHLRQTEPLTKEKQDWYFENAVSKLFDQEKPEQLLFSFLEGNQCIGYGGLVHINWIDKNAEISFIMNTNLEKNYFAKIWSIYLNLIDELAFHELRLHKIYTYAYDLRPHLFEMLNFNNYQQEAKLKEHTNFYGKFIDVLIHSKWNRKIILRPANLGDTDITFKWVNSKEVRKYSFNQSIAPLPEHKAWFENKINSRACLYLIAENQEIPIGSFRCDQMDGELIVSFLLDPSFQGKGFGKKLFMEGIKNAKIKWPNLPVIGLVMPENKASKNLFENAGFEKFVLENGNLKYILKL